MTEEQCQLAIKKLRDLADEVEHPTKKLKEKIHDLQNRLPFFGAERLMPAFYPNLETTAEVLEANYPKDNILWVFDEPDAIMDVLHRRAELYDTLYGETLTRNDLVFPPEVWLQPAEDLDALTHKLNHLQLKSWSATPAGPETLEFKTVGTSDIRQEIMLFSTQNDGTAEQSLLKPLVKRIQKAKQRGELIFLPTQTLGGVHRYKEMLQEAGVHVSLCQEMPVLAQPEDLQAFRQGGATVWAYVAKPTPPAQGGLFPHLGCWVIPEDDVFGRRARRGTQTGKTGF